MRLVISYPEIDSMINFYCFEDPKGSRSDFRVGHENEKKCRFKPISRTSEIHLKTHSLSFQDRPGGQERYADAIQVSRRAVCLKRNSRARGDLLKSWD